MKHFSLLLLIAASSINVAQAAQRSLSDARAIAASALSAKMNVEVAVLDTFHPESSGYRAASSYNNGEFAALRVPYYLFTSADQGAFAFVSGSDLMPEVLGYGLNATLPADRSQWPSSLLSWLDYVAEIEHALEQHPELAAGLQHAQATNVTVSPLLTTKWGQDWPYNLQCPQQNGKLSVTGCMATSVSQVLRYHGWPTHFSGSYTYYMGGQATTMNFANYTFDYSKMLNSYTQNNSTSEQQQEVAKLMHCVGHALSMGYSPEGSGAYAFMGPKAFSQYIGCTKAVTLYRELFSLNEWNDIIQSELQAHRPVVFNGQASSGGHSFVLDGVNGDGYYHVNWGWNGQADGYFDVSILNPEDRGTGASMSADGFSGDQSVVVGLCNPADNPKFYTELRSNSTSLSVNKNSTILGQPITFTAKAFNQSELAFDGKVGVLVRKVNGDIYAREMSSSATHIDGTSYATTANGYFSYNTYGEKTISYAYTFPADMPEGTYRVYLCVQPTGSEEWDVIRFRHMRYSYKTVTVSEGKVSIASSSNFTPNVTISEWIFNNGEEVKCGASNIKVRVKNEGDEDLTGSYFLKLINPAGKSQGEVESTPVSLKIGEEKTISFDVTLSSSGTWKASLRVKDQCVSSDVAYQIGSQQPFDVSYDPTTGAVFSIEKKLWADSAFNHGPSKMKITLKNEGAAYDGQMCVRLYSSSTNTSSRFFLSEFTCPVQFPASKTQEVTLTGEFSINFSSEKKTLYARLFYLKGEEMVQLSSSASSIVVYNRPETGIETISDEQDNDGICYDLLGRQIGPKDIRSNRLLIIDGKMVLVK